MTAETGFVIVGGGSAGCALAGRLADLTDAPITVIEAGPQDRGPRVKVPFGLIWLMGSRRDWRFMSAPQKALGGRRLKVPRGRMLGGSGSINSMVWFRGRSDDFDGWGVPGWAASEVTPAFEQIEEVIRPAPLPDPHPLSMALARTLGSNGAAPPTPERESAGVFHTNMRGGRRWSAADAFLRPAVARGRVRLETGAQVARVLLEETRAVGVVLTDGRKIRAARGVILCAGAIESPALLMRSGIGPAAHLRELGIAVALDAPGVGENLHDHPAIGLHHAGPGSGYGLTWRQLPAWALAPLKFALTGKGRMSSNSVEAGAFFRAGEGEGPPDTQVHFIPFMMGWRGRTIVWGEGYFADVCLCRPKSRGRLRLNADGTPDIDLGLLRDPADLAVLKRAFTRLRRLMAEAPFGTHRAPEVYPGGDLDDAALEAHIRARLGTAYHPVGTVRMGAGDAPLDARLRVKGAAALWVADASVMPNVTSANTNAPSMMIGWRGAQMVAADG